MTQAQASLAIFGRFRVMWTAAQPTVEYVFDNDIAPETTPFVRCALVSLDSEQWTIAPAGSARQWQRKSYIDIRLTSVVNIGRAQSDAFVDTIRSIFEGFRFGGSPGDPGVTTHACSPTELKRDREAPHLWVCQTLTPAEWYEGR